MRNRGFTLVETLLYAGLTTVIITFSILATYQLIESSNRVKSQKELVENQKLLEQKIYWVLQNVSAINSPATDATTTTLSVDKIGFAQNPVVVSVNSSTAFLQRGTGAALPITDDAYVAVQNLTFHQFDFSGQPAIQVSGTLFNGYTSTTAAINTTIIVR